MWGEWEGGGVSKEDVDLSCAFCLGHYART